MALDSDNHSKGFAFVEFEEEVDLFVKIFTCIDSNLLSACRETPQKLSALTTTNSRSVGSQ